MELLHVLTKGHGIIGLCQVQSTNFVSQFWRLFTSPSAIFHVQSNTYQIFDTETSTHFGVINKYYKC